MKPVGSWWTVSVKILWTSTKITKPVSLSIFPFVVSRTQGLVLLIQTNDVLIVIFQFSLDILSTFWFVDKDLKRPLVCQCIFQFVYPSSYIFHSFVSSIGLTQVIHISNTGRKCRTDDPHRTLYNYNNSNIWNTFCDGHFFSTAADFYAQLKLGRRFASSSWKRMPQVKNQVLDSPPSSDNFSLSAPPRNRQMHNCLLNFPASFSLLFRWMDPFERYD